MSETPKTIISYCHYCAVDVTAANIGYSIVGAKDVWCDKPQCYKDAKRWQKAYLKEHGLK